MNKKRFIFIALSLALVFSLVGCVSDETATNEPVSTTKEVTTVQTTTEAPTTAAPTTLAPTTKATQAPQTVADTSPMVYVTPTGSKYHYDDSCNGGSYSASTLDRALARGLGPCGKCVE